MAATSKWELGYENSQRLHRNVMELISSRSKVSKSSSAYANYTDQISSLLLGLQNEIGSLRADLSSAGLTRGEFERREALIDAMSDKEKQLKSLFSQSTLTSLKQQEEEKQRKLLLFQGGGVGVGQVEDWGAAVASSSGRPRGGAAPFQQPSAAFKPESVSASRADILDEQDRGLDSLYEVIVRQKRIAQNIEGEVEIQNEIIDDIGDGIDRTTQRLLDTTQNVTRVHRRDGVCKYWLVIAFLTVVIVIIIAIPAH